MKRLKYTFVMMLAGIAISSLAEYSIANLRDDITNGQTAAWSFQWNETGVSLGNASSYTDLDVVGTTPGAEDFKVNYVTGSENYTNSIGPDLLANNVLSIYNDPAGEKFWILSGLDSVNSTDGRNHYLIIGYTIESWQAGNLRIDPSGSSSDITELVYYVNDTAVITNTGIASVNLENVNAGDTIYIAYLGLEGTTRNARRWYGDIEIVNTASTPPAPPQELTSLETGWTIQKVRTAMHGTNTLIIGSSYEGAVIGYEWDGSALWTNNLSGYMNHDLWCDDLTGDGTDEILVANADGTLYCIEGTTGSNLWNFIPNTSGHLPPMYSVCVVHDGGTPYVVCGAYDMNTYYLSATGSLVKTLVSSTYSKERPWGDDRERAGWAHNANFLRPIPQPDGSELLALLGTCNHMQAKGSVYLFEPLADTPLSITSVKGTDMVGEFRVRDVDGNGTNEVLLGSSGLNEQGMTHFDPVSKSMNVLPLANLGPAGYRVTQADTIEDGGQTKYFMLCGITLTLGVPSGDTNVVSSIERIAGTHSYNDMWKDTDSGKIILASAQSGGSCIHILDPAHPTWKTDFANLNPPGKIQTILANTANVWTNLTTFTKPAWERDPVEVVLTAANPTHPVAINIQANYDSPEFLNYYWARNHSQDPVDWDRDTVLSNNPVYRDKRDSRKDYDWTQAQILADVAAEDDGGTGLAMWGGHGNDPYYYSPETLRKIINLQNGEKTVLIWPEMNGSSEAFEMVMDHLFYPLAGYARTNNANIFIRNKNIFWQGAVHLPAWERMRDGDFSDVFTSGLEETSDKTQELSILGRMGLWAAGSLDSWGMRCSRDNPSFDRQRQHSYQRLPNHFLRNMVYNLAAGATFLNVTYVDADYQSLAWELIATGALYIPTREEIVSFNPVHLSITDPDEHYLDDGENNKWTTFFDQTFQQNNPFVFSRMNGTWPAAPNTDWDFSRYAAGVKDRRQNFLPPYPNGTVLVTPVQDGAFANTNAVRGKMADHLHPMYAGITQEFISNGRHYISSDGSITNAADTYYTTVSNAIASGTAQLPVTVSGNVSWVVAQTSPTHLRLTLVDGGYLNPEAQTASVTFNTVSPVAITDVLDGTAFPMVGNSTTIDVPLGLWRFIDIELSEPFFPDNGWGEFSSNNGLPGNSWADSDGDEISDQMEYTLGSDPNNPASTPTNPWLSFYPDNFVGFNHAELTHSNPGISYIQEWTTNLTTGPWSTNWSSETSTSTTNPAYNITEQTIDGSNEPQVFFRLNIAQP